MKYLYYKYLYQKLMKFAHKHDWHKMERNPHLEAGKIHLWCHWCGIRSVKTNIEEVISIRKASEK